MPEPTTTTKTGFPTPEEFAAAANGPATAEQQGAGIRAYLRVFLGEIDRRSKEHTDRCLRVGPTELYSEEAEGVRNAIADLRKEIGL